MEFNRARTRSKDNEALIRRYREWKEKGKTDSGGKGSFDSSKFGVLEASTDSVNVKLNLSNQRLKKIGGNGKRVKRSTDDFVEFDNVVASSGEKNVKSGLIGRKSKKIEKNKRGAKRNSDDFVEPCHDLRKKCKSSERIRKIQNVDRISVGDDASGDDLDVIELRDDDSEDEDGLPQSVFELKRGRKYLTRSIIANHIVQVEVSDAKSEDRARGSSRKVVVNPKKRRGSMDRDTQNEHVVEMSDDTDESGDNVQIVGANDGSLVNSMCSSSRKEPYSNVVTNCNTSQYKGNDDAASPSHKMGKNCILNNTDQKSIGDSNENDIWKGVINKGKEVKNYVPITDSSEELSKSGNMSSSDLADSSESLYGEEAESASSDEVASSDDDKECKFDDSFVVSHDSSCVGWDEEMEEHEKESMKVKFHATHGSAIGERCEREVTEEATSVAERLRQRRRCGSTKITKLKMKNDVMGTSSCPLTLSDDELECLPEEDVGHGDEIPSDEVRDSRKNVLKDTKEKHKGKRKVRPPAKNVSWAPISVNKILVDSVLENGCAQLEKLVSPKENPSVGVATPPLKWCSNTKKNACSAPIFSVNKILVDSIWETGGALLEKLVSREENPSDGVATLPLKFWFDDEDMELSKKSDWDEEAEKLFEEMDYAMGIRNIGSSYAAMMESEEDIPSKTRKDPAGGCLDGGSHHLVLDEQIGLRCTVCNLVMVEIRNILPDFSKHQGGRAEARDFYRVDYSNFGAVQVEDFTATQLPAFKRRVQAEGTVWDLVPGSRDGMYPHQQEGFEFIWKNIAGSIFIEKAKKCISDGGGLGCIISHAPGTGKTRLTIMFLQTYMQLNSDCRPLIIAPCSLLLTWEEEFRKWNLGLPFHNLNSTDHTGQESKAAVEVVKSDGRPGHDLESTRLVKLFSWKTQKSVLGISYQLFEELANINVLIDGGKKKVKGKDNDIAGQIRKMLLELPGLLVLDEGHIPRNSGSQIWKALSEVHTKRRIMLSGTPFQNNFEELWNTFQIVRPKFFNDIICQTSVNGTEKRRVKRAKEKWALMTNNIGEDDEQKLEDLKGMISNFVHVYKGTILKEKLPGLRQTVIVLSPTELQKDLLEVVQNRNFFKRQHLQSLISVHPSLFSDDLSEKEALPVRRDELRKLRLNPNAGVKTKFLTELIRLSWALKERVLIFSQFLKPLKFIMKQLGDHFHWTEGKEILYMGGEHCEKERQSSINLLNDPESEVRVLLASSRACCEGINLVGASRVVLLDVVWNPSIKRQSISRAYRLGQKKVVHVYLLISGTWEWKKYRRQAGKDRISDLVFSSKDDAHKPESSCSVAEDKILQDMFQHKSMSKIFVKILNQPKESDLIDAFG